MMAAHQEYHLTSVPTARWHLYHDACQMAREDHQEHEWLHGRPERAAAFAWGRFVRLNAFDDEEFACEWFCNAYAVEWQRLDKARARQSAEGGTM